jgi:hypothetical protein
MKASIRFKANVGHRFFCRDLGGVSVPKLLLARKDGVVNFLVPLANLKSFQKKNPCISTGVLV